MLKKRLKVSVAVLGLIAIALGCDVIDDPFRDTGGPTGPCPSTRTDTINPTTSYPDTIYRNILVEDFTGHRCKNCPKATKELVAMKNDLGDDLVILAIHSGSSEFTDPVQPDYPTDFTTQDGDDIQAFFGGVPGQPIGLVNRFDYPGGLPFWEIYPAWRGHSDPYLSQPAIADLWTMSYVSGSCIITHVQSTFLGDHTGNFGVAVYLKENNVVSPQLLEDNSRDEDYVHNNVFRDAISFPTGESWISGSVTDMTNVYKTYKTDLDPSFDPNELQVVAVLLDLDTREVLQVVQTEVE